MTDLGFGFLNAMEHGEKRTAFEEKVVAALGESSKKYFTEGPTLPNWTLGFQLSLEMVKMAYGTVKSKAIEITEDNYTLEKALEVMTPFRITEADITGKGGQYRRHKWHVNRPEMLVSSDPIFDELTKDDVELARKNTPREFIADVIVPDSTIEKETEGGNTLDKILALEPLSENEPILVHYHGGGYARGSPGIYRGALLKIAKETGYRVIAPNYRLTPENPFPSCIHDGYRFFQYLLGQGFKPENIVIMGDSAGGNLVLEIALILKNANEKQPRGIVAFSPWTDLSGTRPAKIENAKYDFIASTGRESVLSAARLYMAPGKKVDEEMLELLKHPFASPLYGNFDDCAPIYMQSGEAEILINDNDNFAKHIGAKSVVIEGMEHPGFNTDDKNLYERYVGMVHVFFLFEEANESHAAIKGVGNFVRRLEK
ncbi:hypothetical protein BB559_002669 [Furculomyces boomerangus]|uniref:Alpha/beta hydrolase fold-3 domain-containing protein n=1 Tax=Furculomyces boomerangus TaxID=61424 RepID=A0A2T9YTF7_9FUNG|nr:hypothetical protein BB559_002669 [Furculomyces boomerangus]